MENLSQICSAKRFKTLKIRKKTTAEMLNIKEDTFIDEDPAKFFATTQGFEEHKLSLENQYNFKARNYIGPPPITKTQTVSHMNEVKKGFIKGLGLKLQSFETVDYKQKFAEVLKGIEKNQKISEKQEKLRFSHMSPREKLIANRQKRILENFQKNNNYWNKLQRNLSEKTMKSTDKLLSSAGYDASRDLHNRDLADNDVQETFYWLLNLRNKVPEKSSIYIPVGNTFSGLFTCVKGKMKVFEEFFPKTMDLDELQVIGMGKLPLEIDAVKTKGPENLDTNLIQKVECDEVIAEQYDKKVLAGKI